MSRFCPIKLIKSAAYHHGDLKKALITTAVKMLQKVSANELSLRELSRQAGVSQAAPYRHFKNKEALLAAISQEGFELKLSYMKAAVEGTTEPVEKIYVCADAYLRMAIQHPEHFKIVTSSYVLPTPEHPELLIAAKNTYLYLTDLIESSQKHGIIGKGDPFHKGMHCWMTVQGFASLYVEKRLEWLGITSANAPSALRVLISQYISGTKSDLEPGLFGFKLFQTEYSKPFLELMMEIKNKK